MPDAIQTAASEVQTVEDTNVKVFIEAPSMEHEPLEPEIEATGSSCVADVELETANTQQLERIDDEPFGEKVEPIAYAEDDTLELTPQISPADIAARENLSSVGAGEMNEETNAQSAPSHAQPMFNDALLDLGDFDNPTPQLVSEDLVLDLDYEEVAGEAAVPQMVADYASAAEAATPAETPAEAIAPELVYEEPPVFELQEEAIITEPSATETITADVIPEQLLTRSRVVPSNTCPRRLSARSPGTSCLNWLSY